MERTRKHILFDHPMLSMLIMPVVLFFAISFAEVPFGGIIKSVLGAGADSHLISCISEIAAAGIVLVLHQIWFGKELHHFFSTKNFGRGLLIGAGVLAVPVFFVTMKVYYTLTGRFEMGNPVLAFFYAFAPGLGEEVIFRIIPISLAMRSRNKNIIATVLIVTSLIFGLVHSANMLAGADPVQTLMQVIYATGLGLTYAAIYLRTGNMWVSVFMHTFTDFNAYFGMSGQQSGGVLADKVTMMVVIGLGALSVIFFTNALVAFRKSKREEIPAVWDRIWGREEITEYAA